MTRTARATHDIIVIGAGSGGLNIAGFMNRAGFRVLLIDKSDASIGGDCLNFGCVPSKALIHIARMAKDARATARFGLTPRGDINLAKVMAYVREKQGVIREHENAAWFRKQGIDVALGEARFTGPQSVTVGGKEYTAKHIVLSTGSRPRPLSVPGADRVRIETNETIFNLRKLPKRLLVIGGGPIGAELGQAFLHLGSAVTFVVRGSFLAKELPEVSGVLRRRLEAEGAEFLTGAVQEFRDARTAVIAGEEGTTTRSFDTVLASIGRLLNIEGLDLEQAGIERDDSGRKLRVDDYLRTTNPNIFVCGDVAGSYQFTHAAELHAGVILNNFFRPRPFWKKVSYDTLSWVTYTSPEIATWGLNEKELQRRGIAYERLTFDLGEDDRAIVDEATDGLLLLFVAKDRLLGGSMVATNAGELAQELFLATSAGLPLKRLFEKIYPYPTATRANKRAISLHYAGKLTPFAKRILRLLY